MFLLTLVVFIEGGGSPLSLLWGIISTYILHYSFTTQYIWLAAGFTYICNGLFLELFPGKRLQKKKYSLDLAQIFPIVGLNFLSSYLLTFVTLSEVTASEQYACFCLLVAGIGNELIYASIHRLLHTKSMYKYHYLHHTQRSPRAFGAIYCSMFEMWVANLPSFVIPLYLLNALLQSF